MRRLGSVEGLEFELDPGAESAHGGAGMGGGGGAE